MHPLDHAGGQVAGPVFHIHRHRAAIRPLKPGRGRQMRQIRQPAQHEGGAQPGRVEARQPHIRGDRLQVLGPEDAELADIADFGALRIEIGHAAA